MRNLIWIPIGTIMFHVVIASFAVGAAVTEALIV